MSLKSAGYIFKYEDLCDKQEIIYKRVLDNSEDGRKII